MEVPMNDLLMWRAARSLGVPSAAGRLKRWRTYDRRQCGQNSWPTSWHTLQFAARPQTLKAEQIPLRRLRANERHLGCVGRPESNHCRVAVRGSRSAAQDGRLLPDIDMDNTGPLEVNRKSPVRLTY